MDGTFSYRCTATRISAPINGTSIFAGKWHGSCEQKRAAISALDGRDLGFACTSVAYRQEYTVSYDDETTAFFTGPQLQRPVPVVKQSLSIPATLSVFGNIPLHKFTRSETTLPRGSWFSGEPWSVSLAGGQGCYEAWANSTHYEEIGNGFNVSQIHSSCPSCAQHGSIGVNGTSNGRCGADGVLSCANSAAFSYRCTARRAVPTCYSPTDLSDYIVEKSPSSLTVVTVRNIASSPLSSSEVYVVGWDTLQVVIAPHFLNGQEPYPHSAYPPTASLVSAAPSPSSLSTATSTLKITPPSASSSFGYAISTEALVAAAGVPDTIDGVPWRHVGININLVVSASRYAKSIGDVVIRVSRWSPTLSSPRVETVIKGTGFRGIDVSTTAFVTNKNDAVYFSGILLTLAEGVVLFCICYLFLFVSAFVFYGVRQMRGSSGPPELAHETQRKGDEIHSAAAKDADGLSDDVSPSAALQNGSVASTDVVLRINVGEAAESVVARDASSSASSEQLLTRPSSSASTTVDVAACDPKPASHDNDNGAVRRVTPQPSSLSSAAAQTFTSMSVTTSMLSNLDNIVSASASVPGVSSSFDRSSSSSSSSSAAAAAAATNSNAPLPSTKISKVERTKSAFVTSSSAGTVSEAAAAAPPYHPPASSVKLKQSITTKEAASAAIDLFNASVPLPAPASVSLPAKAAPVLEKLAPTSSLTQNVKALDVAPRTSSVTSPVPKLDLTKAVQEQVTCVTCDFWHVACDL